MEAPEGTTGAGNLVFATGANGTDNKIIFAAGGYDSGNEQMSITPDQNVHVEINTPSTSPSTGAFTVVGGVGIQGDVNIAGNISFGGSGTTVETNTLSVSDPLIYVGSGNSTDAVDLGLVAEYTDGGTTKYSGVTRDASDGTVKFFKDATVKPTSTVDFTQAGLSYSDIRVGAITATSLSSSSAVSFPSGLNASGGVSLSGTVDVQELREQVVDVTLSSNVGTLDWSAGNIYYISAAPTANMTFNLTNVPTENSKMMSVNVFVTQGSTGYIPTTLQIAGTNQTIRWNNGSNPVPTSVAGKIDVFSFTLQRTSSGTWIVYGSAANNY